MLPCKHCGTKQGRRENGVLGNPGKTFKYTPSRFPEKPSLQYMIQIGVFCQDFLGLGVSGQAVQPAPVTSLKLSMAVCGQKLDGRPSG